MNKGKNRIELIVIDLVERMLFPQDIRIKRNEDVLYTGSARRIPKELLNEKVIAIYTKDYTEYFYICIE